VKSTKANIKMQKKKKKKKKRGFNLAAFVLTTLMHAEFFPNQVIKLTCLFPWVSSFCNYTVISN